MSPEEAKNKMDEMVRNVSTFHLSDGFSISVNVPKDIADLAKLYYDENGPFGDRGTFAAGEVFFYKGIKCYATTITRVYYK